MRKMVLVVVLLLFHCSLLCSAPKDGESRVIREGKALEKNNKFEAALNLYIKEIKIMPTEELYREAASLLGKLQRYGQAEILLSQGLNRFAESLQLINLAALIQFKKGSLGKAKILWEKVLKVEPQNVFAKEWLAKLSKTPATPSSSTSTDKTTDMASTMPQQIEDSNAAEASSSTPLPIEEQQKLAKKLYEDMAKWDKEEVDRFEKAHREIVDKCPKTNYAPDSCMRLGNIYLLSKNEPDYDKVIEIMEYLVKKYPDSPLLPEAKNLLLIAYKNTQRSDKVVELYSELFKITPQPPDDIFMVWALEYADALSAIGRKDDAKKLYEQIVQKDDNKDQLEARVAKDRLSKL